MKRNLRNLLLGLALVGIGSLWLGSLLVGDARGLWISRPGEELINDQKAVPAAGVRSLELRTVSSDIRWHEEEGGAIRIQLRAAAGPDRPVLVVSEEAGRLVAEVRHRPQVQLFHFGSGGSALEIYAPRKVWDEVGIRTVSGDVELGEVEADQVSVKTVSGALEAEGLLASRSELTTTSGNFELERFRGDLIFHSVSGDLRLAAEGPVGTARLNSTSGHLELDLPDDAQFTLEARTVSGDLSTSFPLTVTGAQGGRELKGTVGGGGALLQSRTVSGNLRLY